MYMEQFECKKGNNGRVTCTDKIHIWNILIFRTNEFHLGPYAKKHLKPIQLHKAGTPKHLFNIHYLAYLHSFTAEVILHQLH